MRARAAINRVHSAPNHWLDQPAASFGWTVEAAAGQPLRWADIREEVQFITAYTSPGTIRDLGIYSKQPPFFGGNVHPLNILSILILSLVICSSARADAINRINDSDSAVLASYPDGGEFRCIYSPSGKLMPDSNYWRDRSYKEHRLLTQTWDTLDIRLSDFTGSIVDWNKSEQAGTVHSDNHGGKWAVKLVETQNPDSHAACKERASDGSRGRCYYFFPAEEFAGYWVSWSSSHAVHVTVKYALTKKQLSALGNRSEVDGAAKVKKQESVLERFRKSIPW